MRNNYNCILPMGKERTVWQRMALLFLFFIGTSTLNAQANSYVFSQSNGTYNAITGTVLGTASANTATAASLYNTSFPVTLPFGFNFNSQIYTDITVSSNGYITFGTGAATTASPISSTIAWDGVISAWGRSINSVFDIAGKTGNISWTVEGTAPNRVAVIQWENFRPFYSTSTTAAYIFSFQIRLEETTNIISSVYTTGSVLIGAPTGNGGTMIGLRGPINTDFNNRTNLTTENFVNSSAGNLNTNLQYLNIVATPPGMPTDGLTYTWVPPTCFGPNGLTVSNITATTADVTWSASTSAPANGYDIYYNTTNVAPTSTTTPNYSGVMGLSQTITGLNPSSTYFIWIRSVCSGSDASNWIKAFNSFPTLCVPMTYMYENFDTLATGNIVPNCWIRLAGTGTQTISTVSPNSLPNNVYQYSSSATNKTIVVLPEFSNVNAGTHRLRLKARVTTAPRSVEFGYVTDVADANSFVLIEAKNITNTLYTAIDSEYIIVVPNTIPATARLAIKNPGTTSTTLYYDDVYWEPIPTCLPPSNLAVSNITSSSADIAWTASTTVPANGYDVFYSTTNFAPTAASTPNITGVMGLTQTLSGLTPASTYYVWVRSSCSSTDTSSWVAMQSFDTACVPISYMYENFDSYATGNIVPLCWIRLAGSGTQTISSSTPNSAPNNLYQYSSSTTNQTIVVLPEFSNINAGTHWLRLKARVTAAPKPIEFGYVQSPTDPNTFVLLETKNITNTSYTALDSEYTIVVPNTVPATARLAIKNPGTSSTLLYYDDVYWEPAPSCLPPSNVTGSGNSPSTATLSWTASTTIPANGYEVYYSTTNTPPTSTTVPNITGITGNTTPISGLTPSTSYYAWVRSKCSSSDFSNWSNLSAFFNTKCLPPAVLSTSVSPTPVCVGGTATLSGVTEAGATLNWYDAATAGTLLGTGNSFTTPVLTATTNYWVTASSGGSFNVGKVALESNATTGGGLGSYLIFTALSDFILNTVDLFPFSSTAGTSGTVTITLLSSTGVLITSATVNVIGQSSVALSVPQTVTLNFPIVGGQSYRLGVSAWTGVTNMYRDSTNLAFPYSIPGVVDITGGSLSTPYYYFFYNWNISTKCESDRTMLTATYDSTCMLATNETGGEKGIEIYPNPFTDFVNISDVKGLVSISVSDLSGRTVKTISNPTSKVNLGELKTGMYLLTLKYKDGKVKSIKAIKK